MTGRRAPAHPLRHLLPALLMALLTGFLLAGVARAFTAEAQLSDPALEARAHAISRTLRCLVCQNESIEDSDAGLAADLRHIVRQRLAAGDSDAEVRQFLVDRYGDWVLLNPPFKAKTWALWLGPLVLLLLAATGMVIYFRRRQRDSAVPPAPLSADEQRRLQALLDDGADG